MNPGPIEIVECPACGECQLRKTLLSGNTLGARFFTDGKRIAPMLPEFPTFVKCHDCGVFFKIDDKVISNRVSRIEVYKKLEHSETGKNSFKMPFVQFLTVEEYLQALSKGLCNGNKKDILPLRLSLWRKYNDKVREKRVTSSSKKLFNADEKNSYEDNCRKILSMKAKSEEDIDFLICAELYRNIGEFDKCKTILDKIKDIKRYERAITAIKAACDTGNMFTVEIDVE